MPLTPKIETSVADDLNRRWGVPYDEMEAMGLTDEAWALADLAGRNDGGRETIERITRAIPRQPQTQASLAEQLATLRNIGTRLGLYDAVDAIVEASKNKFTPRAVPATSHQERTMSNPSPAKKPAAKKAPAKKAPAKKAPKKK